MGYLRFQTLAFLVVVTCMCNSIYAELNQQQFVEAIGLLGLGPDALAVAGVSEADLIDAYHAIAESDASWAQVEMQRDALRAALDTIGSNEDGNSMNAVESAKTAFSLAVSSWRSTIFSPIPLSARGKLLQVINQSDSGLPAHLLVRPWTIDELALLTKGVAQHRRNQRTGVVEDSIALNFYLDALSDGEVVAAKANWESRHAIYTQRFTEQLSALN